MATNTKDAFLDAILIERGHELFYEGNRKIDLIRFNKYAQEMYKAKGVMPTHQYMPIPNYAVEQAVSYGKELKQTWERPGWAEDKSKAAAKYKLNLLTEYKDMKRMSYYIIGLLLSLMSWACSDDVETGREEIPVETDGGYLFAHMTNANYGKLYYAASRDGVNWETLNKGRIINSAYIGHPDICQGHDGAFYMIAVNPLALWRSEDLVTWTSAPLDEMIFNRSNAQGFYTTYYWGAPKMFYDKDSGQYIISWHACNDPDKDDWDSMRTLYVLTKDFETYTEPQKLFNFTGTDENMAIIDAIIRKVNGVYYAILKDERDPAVAPETGKTVRIATSSNLTGPYTNPGAPVTPNDMMREAPIFIERPNHSGWFIYAESYAAKPYGYHLFQSTSMDGPWKERTFSGPNVKDGTDRPGARHGCIVKVNETVYQALLKAYKK